MRLRQIKSEDEIRSALQAVREGYGALITTTDHFVPSAPRDNYAFASDPNAARSGRERGRARRVAAHLMKASS
ncbi:hypothetical protein EVAR_16977_1 [Eumeta japonica]|uniref:Uncharacterized protein n=1 Tax=Eumeta variegata TaxID=151549 RepID=A0A4C1TVG8_EUMVA|nr:hypothetical protein EVAR_16977_1 [Eumeta japonica]